MTTLWDTTGTAVVKALAAARRTGGAITSGAALTLIVVTDEEEVGAAEAAATTAASHHPCRLLIVIRRQIEAPVPRLDAEVLIGGRLGPGEAAVMRMYGRLALHAESVTLPLLAPDVPVVTWWSGEPPEKIAHDPLGVFAERRITDCGAASDPVEALRLRAKDYAPGDTDLSWTRITSWRSQLTSAVDSCTTRISGAVVRGNPDDPSALLMAGWLTARLGFRVNVEKLGRAAITEVALDLGKEGTITLRRQPDGMAMLDRGDQGSTVVALPNRPLGDLIAEEVHRLDADQPYGAALAAATGQRRLQDRSGKRTHIWRDPSQQEAAERVVANERNRLPGDESGSAAAQKAAAGRPAQSATQPTDQSATGRKAPAKKPGAKKTATKKTASKKSVSKKAAGKRAAAKKSAPRKAPAKRAARPRKAR